MYMQGFGTESMLQDVNEANNTVRYITKDVSTLLTDTLKAYKHAKKHK